ncbi:PAS domain-containing sensor histidine kinase [Haloplanus sp. C73]|uniref:PAS domain-containing sensor histidine kinase n=1 Tax=Haloplanus sp. C73 TaxID=3421641 RepID=UPI003EBD143D
MSSQERFELAPEHDTHHTGIALYDPTDGSILDANERLEAMFGYTTSQLRDLSVAEYTANTHPYSESEFQDRLQASAAGDPQKFTWRVKRADGVLIWVQLFASRRQFGGQSCVQAEIRDITEYYETYHRAELFWRLLRHNLRNEAAVILGYMDRIGAHAETEAIRDVVATVRERGENLGNMAESVKEIEEAVTDTETDCARRRATEAVREVVNDVTSDYPAAKVSIAERAEMWIDIDDAFTHALTHALENAIIHSDERAPTVDVEIGPSPNTGRVEICITDSNAEIPEEELAALFAPSETTNTSHGSGIGLFVMKWCAESLGGEISFETREPRGNAVYLYFPPKESPKTAA